MAWIAAQLAAGPILASGVRMRYAVLLPVNFNPARRCAVLMWMHTNGSGNRAYPNSNAVDMARIIGADSWFNNAAFQTRYPDTIVVCPACDQTTDHGGAHLNFGGYGEINAANEQSLPLVAREVVAKYNADPARLYGAGGSLGGHGSWGLALDHNAYNGRFSRTFAALIPMAGMIVRAGVQPKDVLVQIHDVPIWAVHGAGDGTSPPGWDRGIWDLLSGGKPRPGAPGARAGDSQFHYLEDPARGHDVWDTYTPNGAGRPIYDWLFAQSATGVVVMPPVVPPPPFVPAGPVTEDKTQVAIGGKIIDTDGHTWSITDDGRVAVDGVPDMSTSNVTALGWVAGVLWQLNTVGKWYADSDGTWLPGTSISPFTPDMPDLPPPEPGTNFAIRGGKIIGLDGKTFIGVGININDGQMAKVTASGASCEPLLKYFPGTTMIRIACRSYQGSEYYRPFIERMTAKRIVLLFEDHTGISKPPYVGAQLTAETTWYANLAAAFKDNPYVWFGCFNEPGKGVTMGLIQAQNAAIYNAVRRSSNAIVALSLPSGGNRGLVGPNARGYDGTAMGGPDMCKSMTRVIWDLHNYGWLSDYNTDPAVIRAVMLGIPPCPANTGARAAQLWLSADGVMPVIIGEFGNSTTGTGIDKNGVALCNVTGRAAADGEIAGFLAWHWNAAGDKYEDQLTSDAGALTVFGRQIAGLIANVATGGGTVTPPPPPPPDPALAQLRTDINAISARLTALGG